jgi:hypothetical protein
MGWVGGDLLGGLLLAALGKLKTFSVHDDPDPPDPATRYYYYAGAGVLGASAIYGFVANVVCTGRVDAMEDAETRSAAHELHMRATDAARAGDCTVAREVDAQIRQQNAEYYRDVFRLDVAIHRCLVASDGAP